MSNINSNVVLTNKKKKKKRRKKFLLPQPKQPIVDSPMTRIAALFKIQQQLANKINNFAQDRPLMSGPRFSPHMKWVNKKFINPQTQQGQLPAPKDPKTNINTPDTNQNKSPNNANASMTLSSENTNQLPEPGTSQISNKSRLPKQHFFSLNPNNKKSNQTVLANYKFHDCEVYDSPSFINFETDEAVTDLNDDDICNKNVTPNTGSEKININKPETQTGFETKLQEQYAKKLESRNQDIKNKKHSTQACEETAVTKQLVQNDNKTSNQDIKQSVTDFNKELREKPNNNVEQRTSQTEQEPQSQGIQKVQNACSVKPQGYTTHTPTNILPYDRPMYIQTDIANVSQIYSPTDVYKGLNEGSPDSDGVSRPSAFQRLGPPEKKPRLTINVNVNQENSVREVRDETEQFIPAHEKQEILNSTDNTVITFLKYWPWTNSVVTRKSVTFRNSKTVMIIEKEYMEEIYDKDTAFFLITLEGYPPKWTKEDVLDLILDHLKGKHFVPCFIEFTPGECKFFVIRSAGALLMIHSLGFVIRRDNVEVKITISQTLLTLRQIDFVPKIVLRARLGMGHDGDKLDLSEFTLKTDISHFIYFPLHRSFNQTELIHLQSSIPWQCLTELNLSRNRITSIEGFRLENTMPKLKSLDLSFNCIESALNLLPIRQLHLLKLSLEGNPLCYDYIDSDHYVKVLKSIFSSLRELDGVQIVRDSVPKSIKNYCPEHCRNIVEKFLEIFFPLLECHQDERKLVQSMYADNAVMTITHKSQLRYNSTNQLTLSLLIKSRNILDGDYDFIQGSSNIVKLLKKWPNVQYDPTTFTVDVVYSTDTSIIFTINGILKITAETLAEDESLISFTRTVTLFTKNGYEYKITNEMVYFDEPYYKWENKAFQIVAISKKASSLKFDSTPDEDSKTRLIYIFMKITNVNKKQCESYLVEKNWNFKEALELFINVINSSNIQTIN